MIITKAELEETVEQTVALANRIQAWAETDQGQLSVGVWYANLHIAGLASTLRAMQGIQERLAGDTDGR